MNNPFDDGSQQNSDSLLDSMQLGLDSHQHSNTQDTDASLYNSLQQLPHHTDSSHSGGNLGYCDAHSGSHHTGFQDLTHSNWVEPSPTSSFGYPGTLQHSTTEPQTGWAELGHPDHYQSNWTNSFPHTDPLDHSTNLDWHQPNTHDLSEPSHYLVDYQLSYDLQHQEHCTSFNCDPVKASDPIHSGDTNSVHIYSDGDVYWDERSRGKAGHIEGQKFYNDGYYGDHYIGSLGADLKVYDANDKCLGWVDASGHAYTKDGTLFASGGTALWAAAVLVYNTCSRG